MPIHSSYPQPNTVYENWLDAIMEEDREKLTQWEQSFIDSMYILLKENGSPESYYHISQSQANKLEDIYSSKTS